MTYYSRKIRFACSLVAIGLLSACSGADDAQDGVPALNSPALSANTPAPNLAPPTDNSVVISGVAIDEYLANAIVWVDLRNNDSLDGFEPFAYTVGEGYFSYNPNTGINYCESSERFLQQFCLKTGVQSGDVVLKAAQGIKTSTATNHLGVLTSTINLAQARTNTEQLVQLGQRPSQNNTQFQTQLDQAIFTLSPLTTLAHYLPANLSVKASLESMGYNLSAYDTDDDILQADYMAKTASPSGELVVAHPNLSLAASNLSSVAAMIATNSDRALSRYDLGDAGLPISSVDAIYAGIAQSLANNAQGLSVQERLENNSSVESVSSSSNTSSSSIRSLQSVSKNQDAFVQNNILNFNTILNAALTHLSQQFSLSIDLSPEALSQEILGQLDSVVNDVSLRTVVQNAQLANDALLETINNSANSEEQLSATDFDLMLSIAALNVALGKDITSANNADKQSIVNISQQLIEQGNPVSSAVLNSIIEENALDVDDLLGQLKTAEENGTIDNPNLVFEAPQTLESQTVESYWSNKRLSVSGRLNDSEQGQVIIFFEQSAQKTAGDVVVCIAYENTQDPSDNISSKRMTGFWSTLSETQQNPVSIVVSSRIKLKVNGESFGRDIPADQNLAGLPRNPNELYGKFLFSLDQDSETWHSDDASINENFGIVDNSDVPQSDAQCSALLDLQVN